MVVYKQATFLQNSWPPQSMECQQRGQDCKRWNRARDWSREATCTDVPPPRTRSVNSDAHDGRTRPYGLAIGRPWDAILAQDVLRCSTDAAIRCQNGPLVLLAHLPARTHFLLLISIEQGVLYLLRPLSSRSNDFNV